MMPDTPTRVTSPRLNRFVSPGRGWLLGFMCAGAALFTWLVVIHGYERSWHTWGVVSADTPFLDLRVITAGAESHAQGFDPLYNNPFDAMQRRMNYPRVWQGLFAFGLTQRHTVPLGIAIVAGFLMGVFVFARHLNALSAAGVATALLSPAVMLCLERGNIDLVLFSVAALALLVLQRSPVLATGVLFGGFVLKLYPIIGLVVLLRENRRRFYLLIFSSAVAVAAYMIWYRTDISAILEATPSQTWLSFGLITTARSLTENLTDVPGPWLIVAQILGSGALVALLAAMVWRLSRQGQATALSEDAMPNLDAFRLGAGIYVGTFLLGSNFDYRLIFLIFTVPQLFDWTRDTARDRRWVSTLTLIVMFIALWQQLWKPWLTPAADEVWWRVVLPNLLEQTAKCSVFVGCAYLLAASAPAWLGERPARAVTWVRNLPGKFTLSAVLLLIVAGLAVQVVHVFQLWDRVPSLIDRPEQRQSALLTQAIFSADKVQADSLRARSLSVQVTSHMVGTTARLLDVSVGQTARFIFLACGGLALTAGWLLSRRLTPLLPARGLWLAAVSWCPALGVSAATVPSSAFIAAGAAWAAVLFCVAWSERGVTRLLAWSGVALVSGLVLSETMASSGAALGWLVLSLSLGGASAWLLGSPWPRIVIWPLACLLPLLAALSHPFSCMGAKQQADVSQRGLVEALREVTPPESVCLIVAGDRLQLQLLDADRRSRSWDGNPTGGFEHRLKEWEQVFISALIVENGTSIDPAYFAVLCSRLNLDDVPTFVHPTAAVYLSRFVREAAVGRLAKEPVFAGVTLATRSESNEFSAPPRMVPPGASKYAFTMITPRPVLYHLAYSYDLWSVQGGPVLPAHVESEVFVPIPAGAKNIIWEFGIIAGAYQQVPGTDGVEFLIEGELPDGGRREIFRQVLDPANRENDRGTQRATIAFAPRRGERLIFRTLPNGNGAFDWAYWRKIKVE